MGGAKAHYDGIKAFSETDFTEDLKRIEVPTLVMHGDDDQIVPYKDAGLLSVKLLKNGDAEDLPRLSARHAHHPRRCDQPGPPGFHQSLSRPLSNTRVSPAFLLRMNEHIKKLTEQASLLPPIERAELVEGILQSLDATDPNLDKLWAEEAKDRLAAYRRGELEALDFDETLAKHASPP